MADPISPTELLGARLLRELGNEEGSLEVLLKDLRTAHTPHPSRTGIPALDDLWRQHGSSSKLTITGRGASLLYHLVDRLVTSLRGTVALIDLDGRFSPSHLSCSCSLQHIHIFRPSKGNVQVTLDSVEQYMLYGEHESKDREWVGTIVYGGTGGDVSVGWRGWLRVERDQVEGFRFGVSVEEAMEEREKRWRVVEGKGWRGVCEIGEFGWKCGKDR